MTAGAAAFPTDNEVDDLWIEMDAAARAPGGLQLSMYMHGTTRELSSNI